MPVLSAKVFRTYNASRLFESELSKSSQNCPTFAKLSLRKKVAIFEQAVAEASILCNHRKTGLKKPTKQLVQLYESLE